MLEKSTTLPSYLVCAAVVGEFPWLVAGIQVPSPSFLDGSSTSSFAVVVINHAICEAKGQPSLVRAADDVGVVVPNLKRKGHHADVGS